MAYGQSSGQTSFNPFAADVLIDAYDRLQIYDLQNKHLISGRRSINLLLTSAWSNKGANLWKFQEVVFPLIEGVIQYNLNRNVASVYDCFRRQYSMQAAQSYPVSFTTVLNTNAVTIDIPGNSSPVGSYIGIGIPVAVGGIVLYGFYLVTATPTANSVTVQAADAATASVTASGAVPQFTTVAASQNVTVTLAVHGYSAGDPFPIAVATVVGGITLLGNYTVQSILNANSFVIHASSNALSSASAFENSGQAYISLQNQVAPYTDILMTQLSRTDYAGQSNKQAAGAPTTLWINKQIAPVVSVWPVTDSTGPYELHLWCMIQVEDVNPTGGQTFDLPPRFYYAMTLDLARDLAMKFAPAMYATLKQEALDAWQMAEQTDTENTSLYILPNLPSGL